MKLIPSIGGLFTKAGRVHLFFCLTVLLLTLFIFWANDRLNHVGAALFAVVFVLSGIYTGRRLCRQLLRTGHWLDLAGSAFSALVIFDLVGVVGYIYLLNPALPPSHYLESGINTMVASFLLLLAGFFITITRAALRKRSAL
jgi:hypothetical protein